MMHHHKMTFYQDNRQNILRMKKKFLLKISIKRVTMKNQWKTREENFRQELINLNLHLTLLILAIMVILLELPYLMNKNYFHKLKIKILRIRI